MISPMLVHSQSIVSRHGKKGTSLPAVRALVTSGINQKETNTAKVKAETEVEVEVRPETKNITKEAEAAMKRIENKLLAFLLYLIKLKILSQSFFFL